MKILWLDINSSYSHSSLALPAIHAQVKEVYEWVVVRGTIKDKPGLLAAKVALHKPDIIASTFWLFTHFMQLEVLSRAHQLLDDVTIICGGPEFIGDNEDFLRRHKFIDFVLRGEGEESLPLWLKDYENFAKFEDYDKATSRTKIPGLCWISPDGVYIDNGIAKVEDFSSLEYPEESPFFSWDKPFIQLETTRGCFNTCGFCVSGGDKPVRVQSLEQIAKRLENVYKHGVKDVRVLDRTFNYDIKRACEMLDLFSKYDGKMRFHLEIHPALLPDRLREKLKSLPSGLLHLEAGIQSLNQKVLDGCGRKGSLEASLDGLKFLSSLDNVETHADLIAGLPFYTLEMVKNDVRSLTEMGVEELQLESLKLLPGTKMRDEAGLHGLKYSPLPPYEVLKTPHIDEFELEVAMQISRMVDFYYNSTPLQKISQKLFTLYPSFILDFTEHLAETGVIDSPLSLERRILILYDYCKKVHPEMLIEVSLTWIEAGFSLKKKPAESSVKIKNLDLFLKEGSWQVKVIYGEMLESHRYYFLAYGDGGYIFGYDSLAHNPSPVFLAKIFTNNQ